MNKEESINKIITSLTADLSILTTAARTAHDAATHAECLPDNKYDTTGGQEEPNGLFERFGEQRGAK